MEKRSELQRYAREDPTSAGDDLSFSDHVLTGGLRLGLLSRRERPGRLVRPRDATRVRSAGPDTDRVLVLGAGPATGWGVLTHELSLIGSLARTIAKETGRGCDVELVGHPDLVARDAHDLLRSRLSRGVAAIVVVLGVNDAITGTSFESWRRSIEALSTEPRDSFPTVEVIFVGIPPIASIPLFRTGLGEVADRRAEVLNSYTRRLCAAESALTFVPLPAPGEPAEATDRHRSAAQYEDWARIISGPVSAALGRRHDRQGSVDTRYDFDEAARQKAVDELPLDELAVNSTLASLIAHARRAFGVETAMVTIIDRARQRHLVKIGMDEAEIPREDSFCAVALTEREPLIVRDALEDERFRLNPLVTGDMHVRFYAGIPLVSASGERLGALCVVGTEPRPDLADDDLGIDYLRQLAVVAERELWARVPAAE